ncbi:THO complex subunit 2-like isoform X1 [Pomacea canaliculata]|uniref:THO complex subunit 2-like isoform X1 n=1 Tax=Pomacea canaliculata TaxID=400727 RepID=UPI000D73B4A1|nr:THO complex subunit 2-like isoform X1 [Pomacea canaliculata]
MALRCIGVEAAKTWEKTGRTDFVNLCRSLSEDNDNARPESLARPLYELCDLVLKGHFKVETAIATLTEIADQVPSLPSVLADVLGVLDVETSSIEEKSVRDKFVSLVSAAVSIVTEGLLKERLDQDTLEVANLVSSRQQFQQKYVKTKTRLYYKQQKFNLLREESEGYSKLIVELNQEITDHVTPESVLQHIKSLIGCFDLDPNRVIDIVLESFECRPHLQNFYLPLLCDYVSDPLTLCHILGFRFHFYLPEDSETPASLFQVAALLLKNGLVDLEHLYPHLLPSDADMQQFQQKELQEAKAYARRLNTIVLADKKEEDKEKEELQKIDLKVNNQKLGLCEALLEIGAWDSAKAILDGLPEGFAISHKPITQALCHLIHATIEPLYAKYTGLTSALTKRRPIPVRRAEIESVTTFSGLHRVVFPMVLYLGPHIAADPALLVKLIRLGKAYMVKRQDGTLSSDDEATYYGLLTIVDDALLPSLSLQPGNCCMAEELWGLVRLYPYEIRYRMYGHWKNETYFTHPKLIRVRADTLERAKYIMRRISKETVKPSGRQLGKLCHSNPGVLFELVLSQIQRYDNFILPVVDSLKYLTAMSYDILAYCIIEAVANPEKERMKTDDTNISLWLQSLASFAGAICRKYTVELTGIMQYVANQLKANKSLDLLLLREVVQKMAGIEVSEEITDDQLESLSGGELLRQEGGNFQQVRNMRKSSTRLKDTLLERDLALSLCLLMAQQRSSVIFREDTGSRHLKLVGKLYDQCQDTLVQFGSFLSMQLSTEEFVKRLPPIDVLISTYHVPQDAAFFLSRPLYAHSIATRYDELIKSDAKNKEASSYTKRYIEASEEIQRPVLEALRPLFPPKIWEDFTPLFFLTFWSLSMYDLKVPTTAYDKQIQLLQAQSNQIEENKDMPQSKKKKEKERCNQLIEKLKEEAKRQQDHVTRVMDRLKKEKDSWFPSGTTKSEMTTNFLQLCIFPRCCFTASDAIYCGQFIHVLHSLKTPNFSTLICYDRIFCDITYTVTSCTENEAHRYGRFLASTLDTIMRWHSSINVYEKECAKYPGFVTVFRKGLDSNNKMDRLDFENFRHVCHKWHFRLTKAIIACLESGNYIQIRNALIILTKILPHYPRIVQIGMAIERRVDKLSKEEKEKRPDIYALAIGYSGLMKNKKTTWVPETEFHIKEPKQPLKGSAAGSAAAASAKEGSQSVNNRRPEDSKVKESKTGGENREDRAKDRGNDRKEKDKRDKKDSKGKSANSTDAGEQQDVVKLSKDKSTDDRKAREVTSSQAAALSRPGEADEMIRRDGKADKLIKEEKPKKSEKKDRERGKEKEERGGKDKSKRSHSQEPEEERTTAVSSSHSSSHRRSIEASPLAVDDRDTKRRKVENAGSSSQSPSIEREGSDKDRETGDYRKEKKREHSMDAGDADMKKRRNDDYYDHYTSKNKVNGEQNGSENRPRERDSRERSKHDGSFKVKDNRKEAMPGPDDSPKLKSKEKKEKSSSKKQKK